MLRLGINPPHCCEFSINCISVKALSTEFIMKGITYLTDKSKSVIAWFSLTLNVLQVPLSPPPMRAQSLF